MMEKREGKCKYLVNTDCQLLRAFIFLAIRGKKKYSWARRSLQESVSLKSFEILCLIGIGSSLFFPVSLSLSFLSLSPLFVPLTLFAFRKNLWEKAPSVKSRADRMNEPLDSPELPNELWLEVKEIFLNSVLFLCY